jgi:hypothetical protein
MSEYGTAGPPFDKASASVTNIATRAEWDQVEPLAVPSDPIRARGCSLLQEARCVQVIPPGRIVP